MRLASLTNAAAAAVLLFAAVAADAAPITVSFPSGMSTVNASLGAFFFQSSHFVTETFAGTGLASVSALDLHVDLGTNVLNSGAFVNFDVLLNGIDVGDIVFTQASGTGAFDFSFGFASILGGGTYTITFDETNTVPVGQGSISFDLANSTATLTESAAVPEPGTLALVVAALLGIVGARKGVAARVT